MLGIAKFEPFNGKNRWVIELYGAGEKDDAVKVTRCLIDGWDKNIKEGDVVESCVRRATIDGADLFRQRQSEFRMRMMNKCDLQEHFSIEDSDHKNIVFEEK